MKTSLPQRSCRFVATPLCASFLRVVRRQASSLPPSSGTWGTLGSAESRQTQTAHTHWGKECGTGTHTQQTEIMQSLPLRTGSPPMYDMRIRLITSVQRACVCVYVRMHRLMHVTHISSVLVQKVGVFGSSGTSKVFHLTAEEHRDVRTYIPNGHSQPPAHVHTCMYVQKLQIHTTLKTLF